MGEGMTIVLPLQLGEKGTNLAPVEEGEPRLWHVTFVYLKHCCCSCHWYIFGVGKGPEATLCTPFIPYVWLAKGMSFKRRDSFPDWGFGWPWLMTQGEARLLRRLALNDTTSAFAGLCRPLQSCWVRVGFGNSQRRGHKHRESMFWWYLGQI